MADTELEVSDATTAKARRSKAHDGGKADMPGEDFDLDRFAVGILRGFGGALIFALPMLMTMEMWWIGFYIDRFRLGVLLTVNIPMLIVLAHYLGFERTDRWRDAVRDAMVACAIAILASTPILALFALLEPGMSADEIVGKIAIQAMPGSIGALLGRSQLGSDSEAGTDPANRSYLLEIMLMATGAIFLGLNVAPTEEMILIAYRIGPWHALALIAVSLICMHGFVYAVAFKGSGDLYAGRPWWESFLVFTLVGYVVALAISLYLLWIFGRTDGQAAMPTLFTAIVLGFPSAVGAAAARLIL